MNEPEPYENQKRRYPTKAERAAIALRQDGRCTECGDKLRPGNVHYDHMHALGLGGGNELDNFRAICTKPCHDEKTADDIAAIAKVKRHRKRAAGLPDDKPKTRWPARKIPSRPFERKPKK